jgi:hypothetical protein
MDKLYRLHLDFLPLLGLPEFLSSVKDVFGPRGTTGVQDTHKTYFREVRYLWHPWYGEQVCVQGEARRGGGVVLRCKRDELQRFPPLEIPAWMFDSGLCSRMDLGTSAHVSSAALLALKELLSPSAADSIELALIQAQHISSSSGGADADTVTTQVQSGRVVLSTGEVAGFAGGSASGDVASAGPDDARTSAEGFSLQRTSRGGR